MHPLAIAVLAAIIVGLTLAVRRVSGQETYVQAFQELVARNVVDVVPTPRRLLRRLKQRVLEQCTVMPSGVRVTPRFIEVRISPEDETSIEELGGMRMIEEDLATALVRHARLEGWQVDGRVVVRIVVDDRVRHGRVPPARARGQLPTQERSTELLYVEAPATEVPGSTVPMVPESRLVLELGAERFEVHGSPEVVGRRHNGRFALDDDTVSWRHAELSRSESGWTIRDLGSTNGTFVDGRPVSPGMPMPLVEGAALRLGALEATVRVGRGAGA